MTPTLAELAKNLADTQTALNIVWTMVAGFLVMFMQAGFALVETGLTRAKNVAHTMGMNFLVYSIGIIGFYFVGFGLQMGGVGALATFGGDATLSKEFVVNLFGKDFGLFGMTGLHAARSSHVHAGAWRRCSSSRWCFMDTTCTIPTGAARRALEVQLVRALQLRDLDASSTRSTRTGSGAAAGSPPLGTNFGLGHGHVDFAGSSVVHMTGGVMALVLGKMIGPRIGKYTRRRPGEPHPAAQHPAGHDSAPSSSPSAGSASTPARPSPAWTPASPSSRRTR